MEDANQPLLSNGDGDHILEQPHYIVNTRHTSSSFKAKEGDIEAINGVGDFFRNFSVESKKLWYLAGPAIFTSICQYSLGAITQVFIGRVGTLDLAAFAIENSVIAGFSFGIMVLYLSVEILTHPFPIL